MSYLPTLNTSSWESDPVRIIDARLASYMISWKLDTTLARNGLMSLDYDISTYSSNTMKMTDTIERSIRNLLDPYIGSLSVEVRVRDSESKDKFNIVAKIKGIDDRGIDIDAIKLFEIVDSTVVRMSNLSQ